MTMNGPGRQKLGQARLNSWQWSKHAWVHSDLLKALIRNYFLPADDATKVSVRASRQCCFHSLISTFTSQNSHRVTQGQSNSAICKLAFQNASPIQTFSQVSPLKPVPIYTNLKQIIHTRISNTSFRRVSLFNITPVKRAHKARTCWYC